ncbi:putative Glutathione S-transferase [Seiridium unicorne]|uniref:Glutathione S-transferase n=1 Tax=Seiridium unicorne TaxID=138068 RepID=A0ABR2UTL6_9PEZI
MDADEEQPTPGHTQPASCPEIKFGTIYTHKNNPRTIPILAIAKSQGLNIDVVYADRCDGDNHEKLLQLNPLGQVPVFVGADGYVLVECIPIALYITSQSDTTSLLGSTRRDYFDILRWMSFANGDMMPAIGGVILPLIGRHIEMRRNGDDCLRIFHRQCKILDDHLKERKYLVGSCLTVADLFVVSLLVFPVSIMHKVLFAKFERLSGWFNEVYQMRMLKDLWGELRLLDIPFPQLEVTE